MWSVRQPLKRFYIMNASIYAQNVCVKYSTIWFSTMAIPTRLANRFYNTNLNEEHRKLCGLLPPEKTNGHMILKHEAPFNIPNDRTKRLRFFILYSFSRGKGLKNIRVICYRDRVRSGVREITHSIVIEIDPISFQTGTVAR